MAKKPIFTQEHIDLWYAEMDMEPPGPSELEWPSFPQVDAFKAGALTVGAAVRFRTSDNRHIEMRMSPVMARELAHWLMHAGQQAGWLDSEYNVISPLAELDG